MTSTVNVKSILSWVGRVTIVHFVTYSLFGVLFFSVLNYGALYASPDVAAYMRSTSDLIVMAGPLFQLVRGPIIALALYPFREVFMGARRGWLLLWGLLLALMVIAPAGAAPGSIEGIVYTKVPLWFHLVSLPEVFLQTLAFSCLLIAWQRRSEKKTQ